MYKVFINDRPIILTDSLFVESDFELQNYKNTIISEVIHKLQKGMVQGVVLFCMDLQNSWENFKGHFKVIIAAGGLVINQKDQINSSKHGRTKILHGSICFGRMTISHNLETRFSLMQ